MKELSLNILDIAQNSVKAGAKHIGIHIFEKANELSFEIIDDGCGMKPEQVEKLIDPFFTTRTTRKVGLGIPFLKLAAEQSGGYISVESRSREDYPDNPGTRVFALFRTDNIDFTPMGDITSTIVSLIQGADTIDYDFSWENENGSAALSTADMREMLGDDVALSSHEILSWAGEYINEQLAVINVQQ